MPPFLPSVEFIANLKQSPLKTNNPKQHFYNLFLRFTAVSAACAGVWRDIVAVFSLDFVVYWHTTTNLSGPRPNLFFFMYHTQKDSMKLCSSVKESAVSDSSCAGCIWQVSTCEQHLSKPLFRWVIFHLSLDNQLPAVGPKRTQSMSKYISPCNITRFGACVQRSWPQRLGSFGFSLRNTESLNARGQRVRGSLCWLESTQF